MKVWPSVPGYTKIVPMIMKNRSCTNKKQEEIEEHIMDLCMVSLVSQVKRTARHVRQRTILILGNLPSYS